MPDAHPPAAETTEAPASSAAEKGLAPVLARNIATQQDRRRRERAESSLQHKAVDAVTDFAGSMTSVWLHALVLTLWVSADLGLLPGVPRFDPHFFDLATVASVEAIFLATFVLISQNRAAEAADRRADLDLQINLLTEHELTRLIALTKAVAEKLGVEAADDPDLEEISRDVAPEAVMDGVKEARDAVSRP